MNDNHQKIVQAIKQAVVQLHPKAETILFGSRAEGDHQSSSDWDVLI